MRWFFILFLALFIGSGPLLAENARWKPYQADTLYRWVERAQAEGIELPSSKKLATDAARGQPNKAGEYDGVLSDTALTLARAWHGRCCGLRPPGNWHIANDWSEDDTRAALDRALETDTLEFFLRMQRPRHPYYDALVGAFAREQDPSRRAILMTNLARWRWMPRAMGDRYLLVNIPAREVTVWDGGRLVDRRRVIVGKRATPTPVFSTQVSGVVLNPWWEIPPSIAREGIAAMVRNNPAAAKARGYVRVGNRYRQKPGEGNALGRMKLVMPNPYNVYLHDTSNRALFEQDERLLSHGCVRVSSAVGFAELLLSIDGWEGEGIASILEGGETQTISLHEPIPIYVAYMTAEPNAFGQIVYYPDVYGRGPDVARSTRTTRPPDLDIATLQLAQ